MTLEREFTVRTSKVGLACITRTLCLLCIAAGMHHVASAATTGQPAGTDSQRCSVLADADFSTLQDAPTQITSTKVENATEDDRGYCGVRGYVAPNIGFALRLPLSGEWNGKLLELGCGGACGSTGHIATCAAALRQGYACIVSDGGHVSSQLDVKWAYNLPQAYIDYYVRASHVTALAGKAILARYYTHAPARSYFMGCSSGGTQAMMEAQRFPWDFDGIVAGAPALSVSSDWINLIWAIRALTSKQGTPILKQPQLDLLHKAVVAECDMNDGVRDGIVGDPRSCHFDPAKLKCTGEASKASSSCLTGPQVAAVQKIYRGPVTSSGEQIVMPSMLRGSERSWLEWFGSRTQPAPLFTYVGDLFRYYLLRPNPGPTWQPDDFDFDRDYKRVGDAAVIEPLNPDLRRFKAAGGKLIAYSGWNDNVEGVLNTTDYYETAQAVAGGRKATQEFFRLFMIPGMNHCSGGDGAFAIDYLSYLENWVEEGVAPDKVIGAHLQLDSLFAAAGVGDSPAMRTLLRRLAFPLDPTTVEFSRPIFPYPVESHYSGNGNPAKAENFIGVEPHH